MLSGASVPFTLDPTGRRAAVVTRNKTHGPDNVPDPWFRVTVYDLPSLSVAAEFAGPGIVYQISWSADGRLLAGTGGVAFVGRVPGGAFVLSPQVFDLSWNGPFGVSTCGRMFTAGVHPQGLRVIETATGQERLRLPVGSNAGFSPDGRLLAAVDSDNTVLLYPLLAAAAAAPRPTTASRPMTGPPSGPRTRPSRSGPSAGWPPTRVRPSRCCETTCRRCPTRTRNGWPN